jgi:hypothetical protein
MPEMHPERQRSDSGHNDEDRERPNVAAAVVAEETVNRDWQAGGGAVERDRSRSQCERIRRDAQVAQLVLLQSSRIVRTGNG